MKLTASGLRSAELCPARPSLPHTHQSHTDAVDGTTMHAERAAADVRPGYRSEVALAFNVFTGEGRELPTQEHRAYPDLGEGWIFGTADTVAVEPTHVVVEDFKSGSGYDTHTEPIATNAQLELGAVALAAVHGKDAAIVLLDYGDTKPPNVRHMDAMDLGAARARLLSIYTEAHKPNPRIVEGDFQCWRCPAFSHCPAKIALAAHLSGATDDSLMREMPIAELTQESAARAWVKLRQIKKVLSVVEGALRGYATSYPIALPNGKTLGEVVGTEDVLDGDVAYRVLREAYGAPVADVALTARVSKASIERAMATIAPKGKGAAFVREALAKIEAEGGVTMKVTREVRES